MATLTDPAMLGARYSLRHITVYSRESGRFHRFVQETDQVSGAVRVLSDERCQKDQMGEIMFLSEAEVEKRAEGAEEDRFCGHCWHRD